MNERWPGLENLQAEVVGDLAGLAVERERLQAREHLLVERARTVGIQWFLIAVLLDVPETELLARHRAVGLGLASRA